MEIVNPLKESHLESLNQDKSRIIIGAIIFIAVSCTFLGYKFAKINSDKYVSCNS